MTIEHFGPFVESGLFSGARATVFGILCNYANEHGECFPSYEAIATGARCIRRTAINEINWLEEHGCIIRLTGDDRPPELRGAARRANVYRINLQLIQIMYAAVSEVKRLAGRKAEKRYAAVRALASWAEKIIEDEGCPALIAKLSERMFNGEMRTLLPNCNSVERTPSDPGKGATDDADGVLTTPKPSDKPIEPSTRARGDAAPDGASPRGAATGAGGEGGSGAGAPDGRTDPDHGSAGRARADGDAPVPKALRWRARDLIIDWALGGDVERQKTFALKNGVGKLVDGKFETPGLRSLAGFRIPGFNLDGAHAEEFVMLIPLTVRREVVGAIDWIERWIAGADQNEPARPFKPLEESLRAYPELASRDARIERLRESVGREGDQTTEEEAA